jgi:site-specific recombinase XerD
MELPAWAVEEQRQNPKAEFWQFHFTEDETKTGCEVHAPLPRQVIPLLEEYISEFRADLIAGVDPGTLFLNEIGRPMRLNTVTDLVSQLTLRHGGRRVTPHLFATSWRTHG